MRKKVKLFIAAIATVLSVSGVVATAPQAAYAACSTPTGCVTSGVDTAGGGGKTTSVQSIIKTVIQVLFFLIGALSVIMIIVGGFRYVVSQGESGRVKSAKDTIMYAVIGLVVAILAWVIVDFVVDNLI